MVEVARMETLHASIAARKVTLLAIVLNPRRTTDLRSLVIRRRKEETIADRRTMGKAKDVEERIPMNLDPLVRLLDPTSLRSR